MTFPIAKKELQQQLTSLYETNEAMIIADWVIEYISGMK